LRRKPFGYSFNRSWLAGLECSNCGIIFIHPQPTQEEIALMYSKEYFKGDFRCGHAGSYFDDQTLKHLTNNTLLQRIQQYKPKGSFLEIGCAGGAFLHAARNAGYSAKGVEISDDAVQFARERFGLDVVRGDVTSAGFRSESFDLILLGDVLEHLPNPVATLMEIRRIMAAGGMLVIECPMQTNTLFSRMGFLVYTVAGLQARVHLPPYHLFEYRPRSLIYLLERSGFAITRKTEGVIAPKDIGLRGTWLQRAGKKFFQYPNYLLTSKCGILGDRMEIFATKREPNLHEDFHAS
jgi:SAM-dependent methyltransferase